MLALAAARHINDGVFAGLLAFGFVVGIVGHIIRSRTMIITGIIIVAVVSCYFSFVYAPTLV